jgi:hypothetical protein
MPAFKRRFTQIVASAGLALAASSAIQQQAHALSITVSGNSYDVLSTNRAYSDDPSLFSNTLMPWFTGDPLDNSLAYSFALAVYNQLGSNSYPPFPGTGGPLFAYAVDSSTVYAVFQDINDPLIQNELQVSSTQAFNFAYQLTAPATPGVPSPLPLLGAAAALHRSRSLRSRLRGGSP